MVQSSAEDVDQYLAELPEARRGEGCLRFRTPEKIDFTLVRDLLRATAATPGPAC
ncbi:hypothetical protein ABZ093_00425 [Streptomyces cyaneofuscatus]|uniref:hypothetical protein n=1 Tax=Streptomyces cyaneofuscatus TaxID=66883 RepID=UPI0033A3BC20